MSDSGEGGSEIVRETADFVEDRPKREEGIRALLRVDEAHSLWEFEDVPLDSGDFGEVVSRGIVESTDGGYRVADRQAVRTGLDSPTADPDVSTTETGSGPSLPLRGVPTSVGDLQRRVAMTRGEAVIVAIGFGLLVGSRFVAVGSVFRDGVVVLPGNDPYYYRFLIERTSAAVASDPTETVGVLRGITVGEPLYLATAAVVVGILGGGAELAGTLLALYPPVSALLTGGFVYLTSVRLTDDRRIGAAAVAALAVVPIHAVRTSVGFADHHAFDYFWLAVTVYALVRVANRRSHPGGETVFSSRGGILLLGAGIAGQTLAWEAGPLLVIPVGMYAWLRALLDLRAGRSPLRGGAPVVVGTALGALAVWIVHVGLGWHSTLVAAAPTALTVGVVLTVGVAELGERREMGIPTVMTVEVMATTLGLFGILLVIPGAGSVVIDEVSWLFDPPSVTETQGLIAIPFDLIAGPIGFFGLALFVAIPYAIWAGTAALRDDHPEWLVVPVYLFYLLALTVMQVRFGGHLGVVISVLFGLWVLHLTSWLALTRTPAVLDPDDRWSRRGSDDGRTLEVDRSRTNEDDDTSRGLERATPGVMLSLLVLVAIVAGPGVLFAVDGQLTVQTETENYRAATIASGYADDHGLSYPEDYVLSRWGKNRMYNYFVNGESASYAYARRNFEAFLSGRDPGGWYARNGNRVGFVAVERRDAFGVLSADSVYARLWAPFDDNDTTEGNLAHYRALYVNDEASIALYRLVPGATLSGRGPTNATVRIATEVRVGERTFVYDRTIRTGDDGRFRVTVPYPGEYEVNSTTVKVKESEVTSGAIIRVSLGGQLIWR